MSKPKLVCFIGDVHAGGKTAVAVPFKLNDKDTYTPSLHQDWLAQCWRDAIEICKKAAVKHDFHLLLGGDLIDGCQHHGSTQTFGTENDQIKLSAELLFPLAEMSVRSFGIFGTPAHAGKGGSNDKAVMEKLEVANEDCDYSHLLEFEGRLLDWAHTTSTGRRPHTRGNSLNNLISDTYITCLETGARKPDLIVRHHVHQTDDRSDGRRGMRAVAVPGWQLASEFIHNLPNSSLADIGFTLWWPKENIIRTKTYAPKNNSITKV